LTGPDRHRPLKVLVDNSVKSFGIVAHGIHESIPGIENPLFLIQARPARTPDEKWLSSQIECLPTIARLSQEGTLKLYTYEELRWEAWKRSDSFPAQPFGNVFRENEITNVPSAIRRGLFSDVEPSEHMKAEALIEFCRLLLDGPLDRLLAAPIWQSKLTDFEKRNLDNIDRFRMICRPLSENQYGDAFHLWTSETNELSYFLTADRKFLRAATNQKKTALPCRPITPSVLLDELGIKERDPLPFEYGCRYLLSGRKYD